MTCAACLPDRLRVHSCLWWHPCRVAEYKQHAKKIIKTLNQSSPLRSTIEAGPYFYQCVRSTVRYVAFAQCLRDPLQLYHRARRVLPDARGARVPEASCVPGPCRSMCGWCSGASPLLVSVVRSTWRSCSASFRSRTRRRCTHTAGPTQRCSSVSTNRFRRLCRFAPVGCRLNLIPCCRLDVSQTPK